MIRRPFRRTTPEPPAPEVEVDWAAAEAFWAKQGRSQLR